MNICIYKSILDSLNCLQENIFILFTRYLFYKYIQQNIKSLAKYYILDLSQMFTFSFFLHFLSTVIWSSNSISFFISSCSLLFFGWFGFFQSLTRQLLIVTFLRRFLYRNQQRCRCYWRPVWKLLKIRWNLAANGHCRKSDH